MNTKLPFFSYGIFRPGEISFIGIKNFIDKAKLFYLLIHCKVHASF